jgi:hypothetical protein
MFSIGILINTPFDGESKMVRAQDADYRSYLGSLQKSFWHQDSFSRGMTSSSCGLILIRDPPYRGRTKLLHDGLIAGPEHRQTSHMDSSQKDLPVSDRRERPGHKSTDPGAVLALTKRNTESGVKRAFEGEADFQFYSSDVRNIRIPLSHLGVLYTDLPESTRRFFLLLLQDRFFWAANFKRRSESPVRGLLSLSGSSPCFGTARNRGFALPLVGGALLRYSLHQRLHLPNALEMLNELITWSTPRQLDCQLIVSNRVSVAIRVLNRSRLNHQEMHLALGSEIGW